MNSSRLSLWGALVRVLSFRLGEEEWKCLEWKHLALGMACTWIAGIGRHWDDERAGLIQKSGLGSLAYVLLLGLFLWLLLSWYMVLVGFKLSRYGNSATRPYRQGIEKNESLHFIN